jgi:hypothetical protein
MQVKSEEQEENTAALPPRNMRPGLISSYYKISEGKNIAWGL